MQEPQRRLRRRLLALFTVLAVGTVTLLVMWRVSAVPLEVHARRAVTAVLEGDTATAWRYTLQEENQRVGLTEGKFIELFNNIVQPALRRFRVMAIKTDVSPDQAAAGAYCLLRDAQGREFEFPLKVYRTEDGAGFDVNALIILCWYAEAIANGESLEDKEDLTRAKAAGLRRSLSIFKRLGLKGLAPFPGGEVVSWDHWLVKWERLTEQR